MALSDSALSEPLDALCVGDGTDLVRELAQWALQQLIEAEAAEKIGVGRYERSKTRATHRNGTRRKTLSTKAGDVALSISKLRASSFFPSLLEPWGWHGLTDIHLSSAIRGKAARFMTWDTKDFPIGQVIEGVAVQEPEAYGQGTLPVA